MEVPVPARVLQRASSGERWEYGVEHTRVPDYWTDGDDLVLFSRRL